VQFSRSFRDIPARRSIGEADVGDENIEDLGVPKPPERAGARTSFQHSPSFSPKLTGYVLTHEPIILDDQGS
jgi:hypothetical protein